MSSNVIQGPWANRPTGQVRLMAVQNGKFREVVLRRRPKIDTRPWFRQNQTLRPPRDLPKGR